MMTLGRDIVSHRSIEKRVDSIEHHETEGSDGHCGTAGDKVLTFFGNSY